MARNVYGLDLGSYEIKVYDKKKDTIWKEKNVIAIANKKEVFAVGDEAVSYTHLDVYKRQDKNAMTMRSRQTMQNVNIEEMYESLGISKKVLEFGKQAELKLKERFEAIDRNAEYNQLKVIGAMQKNRVSEGCFHYASGYGYDDQGRDTLEKVYADVFHTEAALCLLYTST